MPSPTTIKTILIVEDDDGIREALQLFLELEGFNVLGAADGKQALEMLSREPTPNLILLDLMMPVMDGYEFLRVRKFDPNLSRIPVVIVSAFSGDLPSVEVQGIVGKPIDFDVLRELLRKHCS